MTTGKTKIRLDNSDLVSFLGAHDSNIRLIEKEMEVKIGLKGNSFIINGESKDNVNRCINVINGLQDEFIKNRNRFSSKVVKSMIDGKTIYKNGIIVSKSGKLITPRTKGQEKYLKTIEENHIVFGIGPAGTGKTYLAMAVAINYLITGRIERIILTRPAVEAGESIGFLPGDIEQKVNPYLRPLYDAIYDMLSFVEFKHYYEKGAIEVAPLGFMRGRTLHNAFAILDEAQNTSIEQMIMFLTRLGNKAKAVITGDITQVDIKDKAKSGLKIITQIIKDIDGIEFVYLTSDDVVRHPIVQKIINAYEKYTAK